MTSNVIPYLLGVSENSVTVNWESRPGLFTLRVRPRGDAYGSSKSCSPHFRQHSGSEEGIHSVRLDGLRPGTRYGYDIVERGEAVASGEFATQTHGPRSSRYLVLSDPHAFNLREAITDIALLGEYSAMLNIGDMPSGTGYQREQYVNDWFQAFAAPLAALPSVYVPGNHDDGPHFDTYFSHQSEGLHRDSRGRSFSFDQGGVHFVVLDSNPWGLSEMNAINSGVPLERSEAERIEEIKEWLVDDLNSEQSRRAVWRVVLLHHPYTDEFTNRHVVPIFEDLDVDLVLGGHLHSYIKALPIVGSAVQRPVYLTVPSCQDAEVSFRRSSLGERLMTSFPEVVAIGNGNYGELETDSDMMIFRVFGLNDDGRAVLVDEVRLNRSSRAEDIVYSDVCLQWDPQTNVATGTANATNRGSGLTAIRPSLIDNEERQTVSLLGCEDSEKSLAYLDPGESARISFTYRPLTPGPHSLIFLDERVLATVPSPYSITCRAGEIGLRHDYSQVQGLAQLHNPDSQRQNTAVVSLLWDGAEKCSSVVTLGPNEVAAHRVTYDFVDGGRHSVALRVDETVVAEQMVDCDGVLAVVPLVQDRSIWGNHALIRGTPRLECIGESRVLALVEAGDYLEIPSSPSLAGADGFTALVRAEIARTANDDEMAHDPLFVRGKSVGWGATYFARIVVDRNGTMKWGTCYGSKEYGWAGGHAQVGRWSTYSLSFTKEGGGRSQIDGQLTGQVPPIPPTSKLNEYQDMPIFIGYSYIGHVIEEIGRPKYYTALPARIGGVVYGTGNIEAPEEALRSSWDAQQHPDVRVNLDFDAITIAGEHRTEWRRARSYEPDYLRDQDIWSFSRLETVAEVPAGSRASVRVDVSNDAHSVTASAEFDLVDGTTLYDLPNSVKGQFVRITTILVGGAEIDDDLKIPRIHSHTVTCEKGSMRAATRWSTRADWNRGEVDGAVGLLPMNRLHVYDEYTDVIHG